MKKFAAVLMLLVATCAVAQQPKERPSLTLKDTLLLELRETHNQKNWFVSGKEASGGIKAEQTAWTDGKNHSVGQLLQHLVYWNSHALSQLKGEKAKATDDNNETFNYDPKQWDATVKQFDDVMTQLEDLVSKASDADVAKMAPMIARLSMHNAYHIGEMVMVRKEQGSWNPENGVK